MLVCFNIYALEFKKLLGSVTKMYLNDYISKKCEEKDLILVLKNLAKAAIQISKTIKKVKKNRTESAIFKTKNTDGDIQKP
jgi:fructose-1,6-bisphosphatase